MILKARAEKGSLSSARRSSSSMPLTSMPLVGGMSTGLGQEVDDGVEHGLDALVLEGGAAQHRHHLVGDGARAQGPAQVLGGDLLVAQELLGDAVVEVGQGVDQRGRPALGLLDQVGGNLPTSTTSRPCRTLSAQTRAFMPTRSMTPWKLALDADRAAGRRRRWRPRRSLIMSTQRKKSAPMRSILLTKHMRGTPYLSAWRHTVSVCGSTPATASKTATAPSRTRRERSTSTVKSTWPGVSMMLIQVSVPVGRWWRRW